MWETPRSPLSPGETLEPYHDDDAYYYTRVMVKSTLEGVIVVAGKGAYLSVWRHNARATPVFFDNRHFSPYPKETLILMGRNPSSVKCARDD